MSAKAYTATAASQPMMQGRGSAILRLLAVILLPAAGGGLGLLVAVRLGLHGRAQPAALYAGQLLVGALLAHRLYGWRQVGLGSWPPVSSLGWAVLLVGLRLLPWLLLVPLLGWRGDPLLLAGALLYFLLLNATAEELLFRGLLFRALLGLGAGVMFAAAASSLFFGLAHLFSKGLLFLPAFVADGLALTALRVRSDSLLPSITAHAAVNFTTSALLVSAASVTDGVAVAYVAAVVGIDLAYVAACSLRRRRVLVVTV